MPLTKKHLGIFERECRRLQKTWGLNTWTLFVRWGDGKDSTIGALQGSNITNRKLFVYLNPDVEMSGAPITDKVIRDFARHEMLHCVLEPLSTIAASRYISDEERDAAEHEVLESLNRLLPR